MYYTVKILLIYRYFFRHLLSPIVFWRDLKVRDSHSDLLSHVCYYPNLRMKNTPRLSTIFLHRLFESSAEVAGSRAEDVTSPDDQQREELQGVARLGVV